MPIYEYYCANCEAIIEIKKHMNDPNPTKCPKCGKEGLQRRFLPVGFSITQEYIRGCPEQSPAEGEKIRPRTK